MNNAEAAAVLHEYLEPYRRQTHTVLQRLFLAPVATQVTAPSGKRYQVLVQASWTGRPGGDLRVVGGIDDRGWQRFQPLTEEFCVTPEPAPESVTHV